MPYLCQLAARGIRRTSAKCGRPSPSCQADTVARALPGSAPRQRRRRPSPGLPMSARSGLSDLSARHRPWRREAARRRAFACSPTARSRSQCGRKLSGASMSIKRIFSAHPRAGAAHGSATVSPSIITMRLPSIASAFAATGQAAATNSARAAAALITRRSRSSARRGSCLGQRRSDGLANEHQRRRRFPG